jgi:type IV pilus assembly protein PilA
MIVVVIIGILAAIAIPNFIAMQNRAKEGSTKANMHTFQLAAEDYGVQNNGVYAATANTVSGLLPAGGLNFKNPFNGTTTNAFEDKAWATPPTTGATNAGQVAYAESSQAQYAISSQGKANPLPLVLTSGQ